MARLRRRRNTIILVCVLVLALLGAALIVVRMVEEETLPASVPSSCEEQFPGGSMEAQRGYRDCREKELQASSGTASPPMSASPTPAANAATRILGTPRSGLPWHSGVWVGGRFSTSELNGFRDYRGRRADVVTAFSAKDSFETLKKELYPITIWKGFPGRLSYALSIIPQKGDVTLSSIAEGKHDDVWTKVASNLKTHGRGDAIIRVGWESNLPDWPWHVTTANADEYKAAFRRVVKVMRAESPELVFEFGIGCGSGLDGTKDRLAPLTAVYPGDDVVDIVGCDTYDWYDTHASSDATWNNVLQPAKGPGVEDITEFARAHNKGASFGEWGLAKRQGGNNGGGDNPYFVEAMFNFFSVNADVLAYECYFDEPAAYIANSIYGEGQNPKSSEVYARLW